MLGVKTAVVCVASRRPIILKRNHFRRRGALPGPLFGGLFLSILRLGSGFLRSGLPAPTQESETIGNDLRRYTDLVVLVDPLAIPQCTGNADLAAFFEVLVEDFGKFAVGLDLVPLRAGLAVALFVFIIIVCGQAEFGDRTAAGQGAGLRVVAEIADEGD